MSIVMAAVISVLLFIVTGCAISSDPSTASKREAGKKDSTTKIIKRDEGKALNEESRDAIR
jgi:hypothetical protein